MKTKNQLLKEAKLLETRLAKVKQQIAKEETLRMQMLAGIITEGQYKAKLNEAEEKHIYADYSKDGGTPEVKFARVLADNVMAGNDMGSISGLYDEEMSSFINGDPKGFYASKKESLAVFNSLPETFVVTAKLVDEEPFTFTVKKTGPSSYEATES